MLDKDTFNIFLTLFFFIHLGAKEHAANTTRTYNHLIKLQKLNYSQKMWDRNSIYLELPTQLITKVILLFLCFYSWICWIYLEYLEWSMNVHISLKYHHCFKEFQAQEAPGINKLAIYSLNTELSSYLTRHILHLDTYFSIRVAKPKTGR